MPKKVGFHPVHSGLKRRGFAGRVRAGYRDIIRQELAKDASLYIDEVSLLVRARTGRRYSRKCLMAALWDMGYSLKALTHRARAQDDVARAAYLEMMQHYSPEQLVFIDETHISRRDVRRRRGRAGPGRRPVLHDFFPGKVYNVSLLAACDCH